MIASYCSKRPWLSSLRTVFSSRFKLPALLLSRVGWLPFQGSPVSYQPSVLRVNYSLNSSYTYAWSPIAVSCIPSTSSLQNCSKSAAAFWVRRILELSTSFPDNIIVHPNFVNSVTGSPVLPIFGLVSVLIFASLLMPSIKWTWSLGLLSRSVICMPVRWGYFWIASE